MPVGTAFSTTRIDKSQFFDKFFFKNFSYKEKGMQNRQKHLARLQKAYRKSGLRLTPQRMEIYCELAMSSDHPAVEELHRRLLTKFPSLSLDTVYRTLASLVEQRLVHKIDPPAGAARYEVRETPHHHLICRGCKDIVDFPWPFLDQAPLPEAVDCWGIIEDRNLMLYGLCHHCQKKPSGTDIDNHH